MRPYDRVRVPPTRTASGRLRISSRQQVVDMMTASIDHVLSEAEKDRIAASFGAKGVKLSFPTAAEAWEYFRYVIDENKLLLRLTSSDFQDLKKAFLPLFQFMRMDR